MIGVTDTIAALGTPVGTAALAVLRVSGPDAARLSVEIAGSLPKAREMTHVDYRDRRGTLLDDILLTFFPGPRSYTGEDSLEVSCHGNPFIAQKILEDLLARGCRPAEPGEFTQRAFLGGRMDLSQAEAVMDLIHARSERALAVANDQLRGALGRRMSALIDGLLAVLARVEAYIDFPDEDLPPEDRGWVRQEIARLLTETDRLLATSHYGELLRDGIKTVIVGEPNAGKSSLLNRLVGSERALVSPEPGTTRDFIEERVIVGPHCLRLIDTAGLNTTPGSLEKLGIAKTLERIAEADLLLVVLDSVEVTKVGIPSQIELYANDRRAVICLNKSDLLTEESAKALRPAQPAVSPALASTHRVSAKTGDGIEDLVTAIAARADAFQKDVGAEKVAINARHARALSDAKTGLSAATAKLVGNEPVELLASDLRAALAAYGEIAGRVDNERMLDQLFATFCIGK